MKQWLIEKRWRIILGGIVVVSVPILSLFFYVYFEVATHIKDVVLDENRQTADNIASHLEDAINDDIKAGKLLSSRPLLHKAIIQKDRKEMTSRLKSFVENVNTIERVIIADVKGVLIADYPVDPKVLGKNFSDRDWYKGVSSRWEPYVSEFYIRLAEPRRYLFAIAIPVKREDGKPIGILLLQPEKDYIQNEIAHIPTMKNQKIYVVDKKGNLIYHSDFEVNRIIDFSGESPVKKALKGESGEEKIKTTQGDIMLAFYHPVKAFGWGVIVQRPENEVFASHRRITDGLIIFSVLMLLIGFLASLKMSNLMFSLKQLSDKLEDRVNERTAELQKSEERLRLQIDRMPIGCIIWDTNFCVISWNPAAERIFGYSEDEAIGKHPYDIIVPREAQPHVDTIWRRLLEGDETAHSINENMTKDGSSIICDWTNTPLKDKAVIGVLSMVQDITERKEAEEKLKEYFEHLEDMVKDRTKELDNANITLQELNKELEAFTYSASHDLKAPLRSIDGFSQVLLEDYSERLDEEGRDYLSRIRMASQRMGGLIDDLLNLSRLSRMEMHIYTIDLTRMAKEISKELMEGEPERKVEFIIEEDLKANADAHLIRTALENLLRNAYKFTSKKPSARIEFGVKKDEEAMVREEVVYFVKDNGVGFDMAYSDKLFKPFQRLHPPEEFPGSGIGLTIVSRIIRRHGGDVWAEGKVGEGAIFYFSLPKKI